MIEYGEYGTTFYIILEGEVTVRVPVNIETRDYTFKELWEYLHDKKRWLIHNDKYDKALQAVNAYLPEAIKQGMLVNYLNLCNSFRSLSKKYFYLKMRKKLSDS